MALALILCAAMRVTAFAAGDALGDEACIVEGTNALVGIELPGKPPAESPKTHL